MAISLKSLNDPESGKLRPLSVTFGKAVLTLKYSRKDYTPRVEREMNALVQQGMPGNMLSVMILKVVKDWDVITDEDCEIIITPDSLELLPENLKSRVQTSRAGITTLLLKSGDPIPLLPETLLDLVNVNAQAKIVNALAEDQRPNETTSENSDDSF